MNTANAQLGLNGIVKRTQLKILNSSLTRTAEATPAGPMTVAPDTLHPTDPLPPVPAPAGSNTKKALGLAAFAVLVYVIYKA